MYARDGQPACTRNADAARTTGIACKKEHDRVSVPLLFCPRGVRVMHPSARMAVGWERNQSAVPEKEAVAADACPCKERGQAAKAEEKRRRFTFLRRCAGRGIGRCGASAFLAVPAGISALRGVAVCRMAAVTLDFLSRRSSPG